MNASIERRACAPALCTALTDRGSRPRGRRRWQTILVALLALVALIGAACGDDDDASDTGAPDSSDNPAPQDQDSDDELEPQSGGEITFGTYSEAISLDPVKMTGAGVTGAIELGAIYDTIVRWDPETRTYEMRTAESLTPNDDYSEWTLELKAGIKFSDGTDYNAEAVVQSIKRHQEPSNTTVSRQTSAIIKSMTVVDPLTVRFTLTEAWAGFPYVLTDKTAMIVSPAALAKYGENFGNPGAYEGAGAGPFIVESYTPKEALVLRKNPNYYGGGPYLDRIRFINIPGASLTYEALKAGELQMAFLAEAPVTAQAIADGYPGYEAKVHGANVLMFNHGAPITCQGGKPEPKCTGQPDGATVPVETTTSMLDVRRALVTAIDPDTLNMRAYEGKAQVGPELVKEGFPWYPADADRFEYDADKARSYVEAAKAAGWDGKVRLICPSTGIGPTVGQALEAMWEAVGIDVDVDTTKPVPQVVAQVHVQRDFDVACLGLSVRADDGAVNQFSSRFKSGNPFGYSNPEMDRAISELRRAVTDEERTAAFKRVQDIFTQDAVAYPYATTSELIAWDPKVHGPLPNTSTTVMFDKTWIEH
ncbi:MAG TPA: ABC transporter substrate-binding protein [Acidimicrobiales bacterium]